MIGPGFVVGGDFVLSGNFAVIRPALSCKRSPGQGIRSGKLYMNMEQPRAQGSAARSSPQSLIGTMAATVMLVGGMLIYTSPEPTSMAAAAVSERVVGEVSAGGLLLKDRLRVVAIEDPKVRGVVLYMSEFERPLAERVMSGQFSQPSAVAVTCERVGPIVIARDVNRRSDGEEVFYQSRALLPTKGISVRRILDVNTNSLIYVSYSTRIDTSDDQNRSRFKSALCVVHLAAEDIDLGVSTQP
mmetsp:Transcript_25/g.32  ORF Transcript_25/g.32 Transcript_25/m.32 type:complete len:243 (-) Transcript_25:226-954(-)